MTRPHLAEFAELLGAVREQAGLTVRQLGRSTNYSHPHVARAATGKKLPSWQLTSAYLNACGVGGEDLRSWRRLWTIAKDRERRFRRSGPTALPPLAADADWQKAVSAVRAIEPLLPFIRKVTTLDDLSIALVRLGMRRGLDSLRKVEATTGIPWATLHGWYTGKRKPSEARLKAAARQRLAAGQGELDLGLDAVAATGPLEIVSSRMGHLWDALCRAHDVLGFAEAAGGDEVFR